MLAARLYRAGEPLRVEDVETPEIGRGEALVKIRACGICHTDVHFALEGLLKPGKVPQILGHEAAGDVVEVGEGVEGIRKGDRVLIHFYHNCGDCRPCRMGRESLCENLRQFGFNIDGGYAEYAKAPARRLVRLPDNLPYEAGILADSGATALHAVRTVAGLGMGETALVIGVGGVGINLIQVARIAGADVIAVDVVDEKLKLAEELGAFHVINAKSQRIAEEVMRATGGKGVDAIFDTVAVRETIDASIEALRRLGRIIYIGYQPGVDIAVHPLKLIWHELKIMGSRASSKSELEDAVRLASSGRLRLLVTHRFKLEEVNEALAKVARGEIMGRAVIIPP